MKGNARRRRVTVSIAAMCGACLAAFVGANGCNLGDSSDPGAIGKLNFICDPADTSLNNCGQTADTRALTWLAPGDDGSKGQAFQYDLRWATRAFTADEFDSRNEFIDEPQPLPSGTREYLLLPRFRVERDLWIGLKVVDEVARESPITIIGPIRLPYIEVGFLPDDVGAPPVEFGAAIVTGNWNNSKVRDIAIGAPGALNTIPTSPNFGAATGAVFIYLDRQRPDFLKGFSITENSKGLPQAKPDQTPDLVIFGAAAGDRFGATLATHPDLDDDKRPDLIIGAPMAGTGAGAAYIFLGNGASTDPNGSINFAETGTPGTPVPFDLAVSSANITFLGPPGGELGAGIASVKNLDGRSGSELAVGAPGVAETYVFYGGKKSTNALAALGSPPSGVVDLSVPATADVTLLGPPGSRLGEAVASARDLNVDDTSDMAVGAPAGDAVYVFFGGKATATNNQAIDFTQTGRLVFDIATTLPDATIIGGGGGGTFGATLASSDDVFGAAATLIIGDPGADRVVAFLEGTEGQAVDFETAPAAPGGRIVYTIGTDGPADVTLMGVPGEAFGSALATGLDINGGGRSDILIGAPDATDPGSGVAGGAVVAFTGQLLNDNEIPLLSDRADPVDAKQFLVLYHQIAGARFGAAVRSYGNVLFDQLVIRGIFDDFLVGASTEGRAFVEF